MNTREALTLKSPSPGCPKTGEAPAGGRVTFTSTGGQT